LVNYWLCVTNDKNWKIIKQKKIWGVPKRSKSRIEQVKEGDYLIFYVIPGKVSGVFRAVSGPFESNEKIFSWADYGRPETFPYRVKVEPFILPKKPLEFREVIPKLGFIQNKVRWSAYLRTAMRPISKQDYDTIVSFLKRK